MQRPVRRAGAGDRTRARVDQYPRPVSTCSRQGDFDVRANVDAGRYAGGCQRRRERFLLRRRAGSRRTHDRKDRRQRGPRLCRRASRNVENDRRRPFGTPRAHRGAGAFRAREHAAVHVAHCDRRVRASGVDTEKNGRTAGRPDGLFTHAATCGRPAIRPSDRPTNDDSMPTATVIAVPSGTYHHHASPGSQWSGK